MSRRGRRWSSSPSSSRRVEYNPWLFRKLPYRDVEDFAPVALISGGPMMLAVNPRLPARTLGELIALAKAKAGDLNYGGRSATISQ